MSSPITADESNGNDVFTSRFTYRDLRLLGQSSVSSPLRVIALVDFDCFYAQCEAVRLGLPGEQPLGVQQFKHVIAINYAARAAGLKKVVTAIEAKQKCPNIVLQHVPTWREGDTTWAYRDDVHQYMDSDKSSLDYYRLQSRKAFAVMKSTLPDEPPQKIEKAGIDEAFLDLSAQVHNVLLQRYPELVLSTSRSLDSSLPRLPSENVDWADDRVFGTDEPDEDLRIPDWADVALSIGAEIVRNLRTEIFNQLKYTCSAGIARNKVLAKLAAGHNKPNKQTVVRDACVMSFLSTYKFTKLRGLGGKLGNKAVQKFGTELLTDLSAVSQNKMQSELGPSSGLWLYRFIRGVDYSEVVSRTQIKSMMSAKTFTPSIEGLEQAERWLYIFAADIVGRVEEQEGRRPRTIVVHHQPNGRFGPTLSKQAPIPLGAKLDIPCLLGLSRSILVDITREPSSWPCLTLSVGVSDFTDAETANHSLTSFWTPQQHLQDSSLRPSLSKKTIGLCEAPVKTKKRTIMDYQSGPPIGDPKPKPILVSTSDDKLPKRQRNVGSDIRSEDGLCDTAVNDSTEGKYHCPDCKELILAANVLEHLDWHVALNLQDQG